MLPGHAAQQEDTARLKEQQLIVSPPPKKYTANPRDVPTGRNHQFMPSRPYSYKPNIVLSDNTRCDQPRLASGERRLTPSVPPACISSSPPCTLSTILATTPAYRFPCSPSKMTPECRMRLTGCDRERSMYPMTDRFEESMESVCSNSGGMADSELDVGVG